MDTGEAETSQEHVEDTTSTPQADDVNNVDFPSGLPLGQEADLEDDEAEDDFPLDPPDQAPAPVSPSIYGRNRPTRPLSAEIATAIEGYNDDFQAHEEEDDQEEEQEYEEEEEAMEGPSIQELINQARLDQQRVQEGNEVLQKKVRTALEQRSKGRQVATRDMSKLDGAHARYQSTLKAWGEMMEEKERMESGFHSQLFEMKAMLAERIQRADDIGKAYQHFKIEVAKSAEHSKTGKAISTKLLQQLQQEERIKEEEVQRVRLKNIHLNNQLRKLESKIRAKEELVEGLHLIDFEQLKIENQSLNEKIEERNEELLKLRKKTTATVQILTHIKEKLQFVEKENSTFSDELKDLETRLSNMREQLQATKTDRDKLRNTGRKIKEKTVYINKPELLMDMEEQKEVREKMREDLEEIKMRHTRVSERISQTNSRIMFLTKEMGTPGSAMQSTLGRAASGALPRSKVGTPTTSSRMAM